MQIASPLDQLNSVPSFPSPVYGFIFLFKWIERAPIPSQGLYLGG